MAGKITALKSELKRRGEHYLDEEIALICVFKKSKEAATRLAMLTKRTPNAIDWVWAWRDRESTFQDRSRNSIVRQIRRVKRSLGTTVFGSIEM